ncbi:2-dehydropantoate 2-reductase [Daedalea quercina L-15889]|uniref:2-dehydropantoate 2-reductase n=1 Tax=Daedalea quercina L-15889 TaxID=1314783 RepID=A0A165UK91_9APHY|nr:2-dehydropantoate 2-reductase [Daedalea quercina L-15889]
MRSGTEEAGRGLVRRLETSMGKRMMRGSSPGQSRDRCPPATHAPSSDVPRALLGLISPSLSVSAARPIARPLLKRPLATQLRPPAAVALAPLSLELAAAARGPEQMHIHVLGFGAIGSLVSYYLRAALDPKHAISIIHRNPSSALKASYLSRLKLEVGGVVHTQRGISHESFDPAGDLHVREREAAWRRSLIPPREDGEQPQEQPAQADRVQQPQAGPIESLIVATKATDAAQGIRNLLPRLSASSTIVLLHNGMGVYEFLCDNVFRNRLSRPHFIVSSNTHGAFIKQPGHVVHTGVGSIQLGIMPDGIGRDFEASVDPSLSKGEQRLALDDITPLQGDPDATRYLSLRNTISALTSVNALDVSWRPVFDVQLAMQRKLATNCVINPLTALLGCRNGDLFNHSPGKRLAEQICHEVNKVFFAQWRHEIWKLPFRKPGGRGEAPSAEEEPGEGEDASSPSPELMLENPFPSSFSTHQLLQECMYVAGLTRENVSSMLVDIRLSRPTEISYLNGYILKLAKKYHVNVPATAMLIDLIHMREAIPIDKPVPAHSVL